MRHVLLLLLTALFIYANDTNQALLDKGCEYLSQKDYVNAKKVFEEAADKGEVKAIYNLGLMYINAHGVKQNYEKAMYLFEKALEGKDLNSAYDIGAMYRNGEGVKQDNTKAKYYYLIAAKNDFALAQFELSKIYGHEKDMEMFEYWARKALSNGYSPKTKNDEKIVQYLKSIQ